MMITSPSFFPPPFQCIKSKLPKQTPPISLIWCKLFLSKTTQLYYDYIFCNSIGEASLGRGRVFLSLGVVHSEGYNSLFKTSLANAGGLAGGLMFVSFLLELLDPSLLKEELSPC